MIGLPKGTSAEAAYIQGMADGEDDIVSRLMEHATADSVLVLNQLLLGVSYEKQPTCDICGHHQFGPGEDPTNWNGETGNHETCEEFPVDHMLGE